MSTTTRPTGRLGMVARVAAWTTRHRGRVLSTWIVVLVAAVGLFKGAGSDFSNSLTLPGTQSQAAVNALQRGFAKQAGDQDQIVFATAAGSITAPQSRARISRALARVATLPHVVSVVSPYSAHGAHQVAAEPHRRVRDRDLRRAGPVAPGRRHQSRHRHRPVGADIVAAGRARRPGDRACREAVAGIGDGDRTARRDGHPADHLRVVHRDGPADPDNAARPRRWHQPRRDRLPHRPDSRLRHSAGRDDRSRGRASTMRCSSSPDSGKTDSTGRPSTTPSSQPWTPLDAPSSLPARPSSSRCSVSCCSASGCSMAWRSPPRWPSSPPCWPH